MRFILLNIIFGLCCTQPVLALSLQDAQDDPAKMLAPNADLGWLIKDVNKSSLTADQKQKFANFKNIKAQLDDCTKGLEDPRNIKQSILSAAIKNPCIASALKQKTAKDNITDVAAILKANNFDDLKKLVQEKSLADSAASVYRYRSQFEAAQPLPNPSDAKALNEVASGACAACTAEQRNIFINDLKAQLTTPHDPQETYSTATIALNQNRLIKSLNTKIKAILDARNAGDDKKADLIYQDYLLSYQRFTSTPAGALMMTDAIRDKIGQPLAEEKISKKYYLFGPYTAPFHQPLPHKDICTNQRCMSGETETIGLALREVETKIGSFTQCELDAADFAGLIKCNPARAGQLLVINPDLTGQVCAAINNIAAHDQHIKTAFKVADATITALDVASMGLMVTGAFGIAAKAVEYTASASLRVAARQLVKYAANREGRQILMDEAQSATVGSYTAAEVMGKTALIGTTSQVLTLSRTGGVLASVSGNESMLVSARLADATSEVEVKQIVDLESKWHQSIVALAKGAILNVIPVSEAIMKVRAGAMANWFSKGKGLSDELAADEKYRSTVTALGADGITALGDYVKNNSEKATNVAAALLVVSQSKDAVQKLNLLQKTGRLTNALLEKLENLGGRALICQM